MYCNNIQKVKNHSGEISRHVQDEILMNFNTLVSLNVTMHDSTAPEKLYKIICLSISLQLVRERMLI